MVDVIARIATDLTALDLDTFYDNSADIWNFTPTPGSSTDNLQNFGLESWVTAFLSQVDSAVGIEWAVSGGLADSYFFGAGLTLSGADVITGGTLHYLLATNAGHLALAIGGLNLSAATVYQAVVSAGTADNIAVLRGMLSGSDTFRMSAQADKVMGYAGNDLISGNGGNDTLSGGTGNDTILGGTGNDTILGGAENDILVGGAGKDLLNGGNGADLFIFKAITDTGATGATADVISDFNSGTDRVVLSGIDASTVLDGNNAFEFLGTATAGTSAAGSVRYVKIDNDGTAHDFTIVYLDTDADPAAEGVIRFCGLVDFTAADFVL